MSQLTLSLQMWIHRLLFPPIAIHAITGIDLADANRIAFHDPEAFNPVGHGILALVAVASWYFAARIRFPSAMLLLPLPSSALLALAMIVRPLSRHHVLRVLLIVAVLPIAVGRAAQPGRNGLAGSREFPRGWSVARAGGLGAALAPYIFSQAGSGRESGSGKRMTMKLAGLNLPLWMLLFAGMLAISFAAAGRASDTSTIAGRAAVVDGDGLHVGPVTVRIHGIDAPEFDQHCPRLSGGSWACGAEAAERLRALAEGR